MGTAFLFPGQGSQYAGMAGDLYDRYPATQTLVEKANAIVGFDLGDMMFSEGADEEILKRTDVTQPAIFVHSMAAFQVLDSGRQAPNCCAGHSVGEYSALTAAGAFSFEDGLGLVALRGRLMAEAGDIQPGTMSAVIGLSEDEIERACEQAAKETGAVVQAANFNADGQIVISGDLRAVQRAGEIASQAGAKRVIPLQVSGAFHSPLMADAIGGLTEALETATINRPGVPVYLNVTALPTRDPDEIRSRLIEQLTAPVRWAQTLRNMHEQSVDRFVEVGPGRVLTGLVRRTVGRDVAAVTAGTYDEIESLTGSNTD